MHALHISRSYRTLCGVKNEFCITRYPPTAVLRCEQHTDKDSPNTNYYFQRLVVDYKDILVGTENAMAVLDGAFKSLSKKYTDMTYRISLCSKKKRVALMVSKESHCMYDLLMRTRSGELDCDIVLITSNHDKLKPVADMFGIPFRFVSCFACVCLPPLFLQDFQSPTTFLPS